MFDPLAWKNGTNFKERVMASFHVHVSNNKGMLSVLEYFYSSTVFVNVGGRG